MSADRIFAVVAKELAELRRNPAVFVPMLVTTGTIVLPFIIGIGIPRLVGDDLASDSDFRAAVAAAARYAPALQSLAPEAAVQAFLFQQFLLLFLLIPVAGSMSLAAYSIVGEKQTRSLEPLLATPITTSELLTAKILAALGPSLVVEATALLLFLGGVAALAAEGVLAFLLSARSLLIVIVLGPLAALMALQLVVMVSSRVNDPRGAQQIGVLVVLPVVGLMVAQFAGVLWLTIPVILMIAAALAALCVLLGAAAVAIFDRETILTRWK